MAQGRPRPRWERRAVQTAPALRGRQHLSVRVRRRAGFGREPMSDPAPTVTNMTEHDAGDRLARLLLPYRRRGSEDADGPDHRVGWWFTDAPPGVTREALSLVDTTRARRPNDQPPEE